MYRTDMDIMDLFFGKTGLTGEAPRYPLTNISTDESGIAFIEIACAGFKKEWLTIEVQDSTIIVTGEWRGDDESKFKYHQKHISESSFTRKIKMHESYDLDSISVDDEDGMLVIFIEPKKEKTPKTRLIEF